MTEEAINKAAILRKKVEEIATYFSKGYEMLSEVYKELSIIEKEVNEEEGLDG